MKRYVLRTTLIALALLVLAALALLTSGGGRRGVEAVRLLRDLAALDAPAASHKILPTMRAPLAYEVEGRRYQADVYRPLAPPRMGVVLLPGASPLGKDDPRLVDFAAWLAAAQFIVLVPDIARLRQLQLRSDIIPETIDALRYMGSTSNLAPQGKVGIVALSVAAGPALLAARAPSVRDRVSFVLAVGGYYDLLSTLNFSITGYYKADDQWRHRRPQGLGKWVFVLSNADSLPAASDREALTEMAKRRLAGEDPSVLAPRLSRDGQAVYRFVNNTDPDKARILFDQLPPAIIAEVNALSPSKQDLSTLHARVILVHGLDDAIIPYTESVALAHALPVKQCELFLIRGLHHVDVKPTFSDSWHTLQAIYAVLTERDRINTGAGA